MNLTDIYNEGLPQFYVIIAGGRDFNDYKLLQKECDYLLQNLVGKYDIVIISGAAKGADTLGERYARIRGFRLKRMPADWDKYGKSAGYRRNVDMANAADACICFWDRYSKGTSHMINIALAKGLQLVEINY
jgi:hypothetical protein